MRAKNGQTFNDACQKAKLSMREFENPRKYTTVSSSLD